jgi:hypothetical protein
MDGAVLHLLRRPAHEGHLPRFRPHRLGRTPAIRLLSAPSGEWNHASRGSAPLICAGRGWVRNHGAPRAATPQRWHTCPSCELSLHPDHNAAIGVPKKGGSTALGETGEVFPPKNPERHHPSAWECQVFTDIPHVRMAGPPSTLSSPGHVVRAFLPSLPSVPCRQFRTGAERRHHW